MVHWPLPQIGFSCPMAVSTHASRRIEMKRTLNTKDESVTRSVLALVVVSAEAVARVGAGGWGGRGDGPL